MRKTSIQAIIDIGLILAFVTFVILYSRLDAPRVSMRCAWVCAFLIAVSVILFSKFILYRRQNFLFFALVFLAYLMVFVTNLDIFDYIILRKFGVFIVIPGIISMLFYLRYWEMYQLRIGVFLSFVGIILLMLFG